MTKRVLCSAELESVVHGPRRENYEEHLRYHRKEIRIDFRVKGDPNLYMLSASNVLHETGVRNRYYEIMMQKELDDRTLVWGDIDFSLTNKTCPLIETLLNHPDVKLFYEWLVINKDPGKIGHDGFFR
jgi:hypothetical protein